MPRDLTFKDERLWRAFDWTAMVGTCRCCAATFYGGLSSNLSRGFMLDNRKTLDNALYTRYQCVQSRLFAQALKAKVLELRTRAEAAKLRAIAVTSDGHRQNSNGAS